MKKAISILIVISFLFALSSCKEEKPKISDQHYQYGKKAVEIADKFLNYEISTQKAYTLLETLIDEEENLPVTDDYDDTHLNNYNVVQKTHHLNTRILFFNSNLISKNNLDKHFEEIYEFRNAIAETIGEKTIEQIPFDVERQPFNDRFFKYSLSAWCEVAEDGSYIAIDTNYFDLDASHFENGPYQDDNALRAIKDINTILGFPESVHKKMTQTRSLDGRQQEENEKFIVSWTYHPDTGLEVMYERK